MTSHTIVENFKEVIPNQVLPNEGIRKFTVYTNTAYNSDVPFTHNDETHIRITNDRQDITQLNQTYLTIELEAKVNFASTKPMRLWYTSADRYPGYQIPFQFFVGWKNAAEAIRMLQVENRGVTTGLLDKEVSKSSFYYNTLMPNEKKKSTMFAHTTFEDAYAGNPNVCGGYFVRTYDQCISDRKVKKEYLNEILRYKSDNSGPVADQDKDVTNEQYFVYVGTQMTIPITFTLPVTEIMQLSNFTDWINDYGDIVLKFYLNKDSMVYCQCDPWPAVNRRGLSSQTTETIYKDYLTTYRWCVPHSFAQVGTSTDWLCDLGVSYVNNKNETKFPEPLKPAPATISVESLTCTRMRCDCYGFNVTDNVKSLLSSLYTEDNPLCIPAKQFDVRTFPYAVNSGSHYMSDMAHTLNNVEDFIIVFPQVGNESTCFRNPCIRNLQLKVNDIQYPEQAFDDTYGPRFVNAMLKATHIPKASDMNKEFLQSLCTQRTWNATANKPYASTCEDTSFFVIFQTERNCPGTYFDGLISDSLSVSINLQFDFTEVGKSNIAPEIWILKHTFWTVDRLNGLKYHENEQPTIVG